MDSSLHDLYQQFQQEEQKHGSFSSYQQACKQDEALIAGTDLTLTPLSLIPPISNGSPYIKSSQTHMTLPQLPISKSSLEKLSTPKFTYVCPLCESQQIIVNSIGLLICAQSNCGVELGIDVSAELESQYAGRATTDNGATARSGPVINNLLYDSNLKTKIRGNRTTSSNLRRMVNEWDNLNPEERSLVKDFNRISQICREGRLPNNVINYSQVLFKQTTDKQKKLPKGKNSRADNRTGLILGAIDTSCKKYSINRDHVELAQMAKVNKSVVSNGIKIFRKLMSREINLTDHTTNYKDFITRFSWYLGLNTQEVDLIHQICEQVNQSQLMASSKPQTLTAVSIYFASSLYSFDLERKEIADKCGTTETTLTKNYRLLFDHVAELIV